jgi:hypothetical protein
MGYGVINHDTPCSTSQSAQQPPVDHSPTFSLLQLVADIAILSEDVANIHDWVI